VSDLVAFLLDGREVTAEAGETLLEAARRHGAEIPHLCQREGLRPDGNCRACVVEIAGERALAPACCRRPERGMAVVTRSDRVRRAQGLVLELLLAEAGTAHPLPDSELGRWAGTLGLGPPRFRRRAPVDEDLTHPAIAVRLDACIQCTRCLRACREEQANDVIGYAYRGARSSIVFDAADPLGASSCVACGECVQVCPTGALLPAGADAVTETERGVDSVCPYCGVGCLLRFEVRDNRILRVSGRDGPANRGRLCVKGRFGFDYVHHPERLTRPLIRREGVPKTLEGFDPAHPEAVFREADWVEALDLAAGGLRAIRDGDGPQALAGFGSAKGSNEEAYLFQKLVRTGFGTNNLDHCTRLCHASSVAALLEGIGSGAVSNPVADVAEAEVILVIGSNTSENHPVAATFMKNAARAGKTLILLDPRRTPLARHARWFLQFRPDTDVPLLNGLLHTIVEEGLTNDAFIRERTEGFEALRRTVAAYAPERVAPVCGVDAGTLRAVARAYAKARSSMIFWGMGISQHVHGTDNARCLIALALVTGQIGRPGTGLHPLRGQNNVQGASDAGLIPMVLPDYQRVDDPAVRARFERAWGASLDGRPGLTVVEILHAAREGRIRGMYILGENPAMSDPNLREARAGLAALRHLVVQDIFLTETAAFADVVLPASAFPEKTGTFTNTDRRVQLGRQALSPPGEARQDLWIIQQLARRLGLDWDYGGPEAVFGEMRGLMPSIAGITWERLEREGSLTYPLRREGDPGEPVVFTRGFPTPSGRARLVPADFKPAAELPDEAYPLVLITGRLLEHWHTGAMTRRSRVLDALEPVPVVGIHPGDLVGLGVEAGAAVVLESRRGRLIARVRPDPGLRSGEVFLPFCYREAAANLLTNDALDPFGKIPEYKYCAVRVASAG